MARPRELEWAQAYLAQARADFAAAAALAGAAECSVFAMLLQMTFEKLSKAAMLRLSTLSIRQANGAHQAAAAFLQTITRDERIATALGHRSASDFFLATLRLIPVINQLEASNPSVARRTARASRGGASPTPILEYPWEDAQAKVCWPEEHHPLVRDLKDPQLNLKSGLLEFADALLKRFDSAFPP